MPFRLIYENPDPDAVPGSICVVIPSPNRLRVEVPDPDATKLLTTPVMGLLDPDEPESEDNPMMEIGTEDTFVSDPDGKKLVEETDDEHKARIIATVPNGVDFREVPTDDIPSDRTFRAAWRDDGAAVNTNMTHARNIWRDKIRIARVPELTRLDNKHAGLVRDGQSVNAVNDEKQALLDAPADQDIDAAITPDELKLVQPAGLTIE